ncbi:MAG: SMC family ATPase [Sulfolobales archaeon]
MIVRHVKLTNILSHENTEVEFPDGIVAIIGPNGAGKSSIIDSIYTALFTDATIDIRGRKKEFIVMRGRRKGEIEVSLEIGGVKYSVIRELSIDSPAQASLYILDGGGKKLKSTGVSNVVNELGKVLGLSALSVKDLRSIIRSTLISLQDELTEIVDISDSERREWILSLLGLSYLEKSLEAVKKYTASKDSKYAILKDRLRGEEVLMESKKKELAELRTKKKTYINDLVEINKTVNDLKEKYESVKEKMALVDKGIELLNKLENLFIVKRIKELEDLIPNLKVLDEWDINNYVQIRKEFESMSAELSSIKNQVATLLQNTSNKLGVPINSYDGLRALIAELSSKNEELAGKINQIRALKELYTIYVSKLESRGKCPICGSVINDPTAIKSSLTKEIDKLNEEIKTLDNESTVVKAKIEVAQNSLERLSKLVSKVEIVEKAVQEAADRLNALKYKAMQICGSLPEEFKTHTSVNECVELLTALKDRLSKFRAELEFLKRLGEGVVADELRTDVKLVQSMLGDVLVMLALNVGVPQELKDVKLVRDKLAETSRKLKLELDNVNKKLAEVEGSRKSLEDRLKEVNDRINVLEGEVRDAEKRIAELRAQIRAYEVVNEFCSKYLGKDGLIARELTKVARTELERRANRILVKLGLRPIEINDDFQIRVKVLGGELPINNASGGERVGISIALRLALAELIMGRTPTTLILDEPTVYLDEERRKQIFEIIKELSKSLRQVIVVTHDESVIHIANKVIRVENVGEVSRVITQS